MNQKADWKKYLYSFAITAVIFVTAIYLSNFFGQKKLDEIRSTQEKVSLDILSSETQFSLLETSSCTDAANGALSTDLGTLEDQLASAESDRGHSDPQVQSLKRYYSLLEIKDYLLMGQISQKCKKTPLSIIYFYSTDNTCADCEREGYVLDSLRQSYPDLRVYSFDYNLDLSAVKTLISIYKIKNTLPAIIVNGKVYYGFQSLEDIQKSLPALAQLKAAQATGTKQ